MRFYFDPEPVVASGVRGDIRAHCSGIGLTGASKTYHTWNMPVTRDC